MLDSLPESALPFAGLSWPALALVGAAFFLGFFVRGAFGFGSNLPIVVLTTWVLGPHHAIVLTVLTALAAQVHLFPQGLKTADWGVARPLVAGLVAGTAAGTWLFAVLPPDWLTLIMGVLIVVIVSTDRLGLLQRLVTRVDLRSPTLSAGLATVSGAAGTVSGGGGMYFLVVYLKLACATPLSLRGTSLFLSGIFQGGRAAFVAIAGFVSLQLLLETLALMPVVLLGTWTGTRFFQRATASRFYAGLQLVLLAAAAALIVRGTARLS